MLRRTRKLIWLLFAGAVLAILLMGPGDAQRTATNTGDGQSRDTGDGGPNIRGDIVSGPGGAPEYMVIGPPEQSAAAIAVLREAGATLRRTRDYPDLDRRGLYFTFPQGLPVAIAQTLLTRAAPQSIVDLHAQYRYAQGSPRLYAPEMVGLLPGRCNLAQSVTLGLIDGPVDAAHPALAGVTLINESVLNAGDRTPDAEHGTAVAILMAGRDPGGALAGFAGGAQLHAISAFTRERGREVADIERIGAALDRLIGRNVRLINMSFAGEPNRAMAGVLAAAAARGAVMIAAAGNNGRQFDAYPAGYQDVIAVTAIDAAYRRYSRANFGAHIEFAAPGVELYIATGRGGGYASGTSYAAPILTALAARLAPSGSVETVRARLRAAALDLGPPGRDGEFGWGMVRAPGC